VGTSDLIALAKQTAAAHNLYPEIICAICERESSWNPQATRYEHGFYEHYIKPLIENGTVGISEAYDRSTSWGLMQVMGQVAREHGYEGVIARLCDPATGIEFGCRTFASKLATAEGDVTKALQLYNGGGNANYAAEVLSFAGKYK
jgi:soluble lytic murein transglycosylase-like protein